MYLNVLLKMMILSNPLCFSSKWKCLCDIFVNNSIDYNFSNNGFSHSYIIDEDAEINKSRLKILENALKTSNSDLDLINYHHAVFMCDFIEQNIDEMLLGKDFAPIHNKCFTDFCISSDSNIWSITVNHPKEIIIEAIDCAQELAHLLWSEQCVEGKPEDSNIWRSAKDYDDYIKLKKLIDSLNGDTK